MKTIKLGFSWADSQQGC